MNAATGKSDVTLKEAMLGVSRVTIVLGVMAALVLGGWKMGYDAGVAHMEEWAVGRGAGIYCPMDGRFRFNGDC